MRLIGLILLFITSSLHAGILQGHHLQNGCSIHALTGEKIFTAPGDYCIFRDDGSIVSASSSAVRLLNSDLSVAWNIELPVHHQMNLSESKDRILLLSSSFLSENGVGMRDDRFVVISLDGKILHDQSIGHLLPADRLLHLPIHNEFNVFHNVRIERSHFNSIFEIPEVPVRPDAPWLKRGNIIANSVKLGVLVLSPDLKTVLHHFTYPASVGHQVHDVKITPSGRLLLFNNMCVTKSTEVAFSTIDEVDPVTFAPSFVFGNNEKMHFFAGSRSGTHVIDKDHLAFSLEWQGVYVLSRKRRKIIFANHTVNTGPYGIISNQEVRVVRLGQFLKYHKGLPTMGK